MNRTLRKLPNLLLIAGLLAGLDAAAAGRNLDIELCDERGHPLAGAVAYAIPEPVAATLPQRNLTVVMDQVNNEFAPEPLFIAAGPQVTFLRSDATSHHAYSFSEAKRFKLSLSLFKGNARPPVLFDRSGLIIRGYNIHALMIGYVLVVEMPYKER
ncbi:MAG: hypothetical protein QF790_06110 [Gammaproteobacteria bacterium]|nr:hypothetical protein [Gammaproteobacteria bacterium]MDP6616721.1 hypothetical protein [Gammaproteobacteria bacterium]MDP6695214.1 hypothetical protein [Gammaproteobacteria bacterium]